MTHGSIHPVNHQPQKELLSMKWFEKLGSVETASHLLPGDDLNVGDGEVKSVERVLHADGKVNIETSDGDKYSLDADEPVTAVQTHWLFR
jgi:hypothetical protein